MFDPRPVFWSSAAALPPSALAGYAWDGADLVIGDAGIAARGAVPPWQADGCHLLCAVQGQGHLIATDGRGFARMFLYRSAGRWAVSNSFAALVSGVVALGWKVTPQAWAINAWMKPETSFDQLPWMATAAAEIRFLPHWQAVAIDGRGRVSVVDRLAPKPAEVGLDPALRLWLSRIMTIIAAPGMALTMELTGGLDSRACLAMALHLRDSGQLADLSAVGFISALHQPEDLAIAQDLEGIYGLALNAGHADRPLLPRSEAERYRLWRDWSLGMFAAPYVPADTYDPGQVVLGGHAGEFLRALPWAPSRRWMMHSGLSVEGLRGKWALQRALAEAWRAASRQYAPDIAASLKHRWAFRLRQLAGHQMQSALRMAPLAGMDFGRWLAGRPASDLAGGRLQFEIMERLCPGISGHPFENPAYQAPMDIARGGATLIAVPGRVYGFDPAFTPPKDAGPKPAPGRWQETVGSLMRVDLEQAIAAGAADVIGPGAVEAARAALRRVPKLPGNARFPGRIEFRPVHATLLAGLLALARQGPGRPGV